MNSETEGELEAIEDENYTFCAKSSDIKSDNSEAELEHDECDCSSSEDIQLDGQTRSETAMLEWPQGTVITLMTHLCLGIYVNTVQYCSMFCGFTIIPDKIEHLTESSASPTEHDI